ncbi:restriction endonuclease [Desulfogranum marinum]|uniref:restriction endonuclease n=1 Tax=Desulfogranum marinum TaxID=453220 RepID=UPI0029C90A3C|nr:restriction endonuclease [Desulfogranum marinum]
MARKKSTADDIVEITARFPWWVGGALALFSYFLLHSFATKEFQVAGQDIGQAMGRGMVHGIATIGQYILPALFVFGAVASLVSNSKRNKLYGEVTASKKTLSDISWQQFEVLIGEHFRREGYLVKETGPGADGGVDLVLRKGGGKYLVQCKHWKAYKVGVKPVRELLGVMASSGAAGGYVIASGQFTRDAVKFAEENNIELLGGESLKRILGAKGAVPVQSHNVPKHEPALSNEVSSAKVEPVCPKCGSPMVLRTAKKGSRAGQQFWGCFTFPTCRSTRPVS